MSDVGLRRPSAPLPYKMTECKSSRKTWRAAATNVATATPETPGKPSGSFPTGDSIADMVRESLRRSKEFNSGRVETIPCQCGFNSSSDERGPHRVKLSLPGNCPIRVNNQADSRLVTETHQATAILTEACRPTLRFGGCAPECKSVSSGRIRDGYRVRGAGHREYDAVMPCSKLGAPKIGASVPPAWTEPPGALSWVSLTSPKGVEPGPATLVRMSERLARHGLSPHGSSSEPCSS